MKKKAEIDNMIQKVVAMYHSAKHRNNENWYAEWYCFREGMMFCIQSLTSMNDTEMSKITKMIDNEIYGNGGVNNDKTIRPSKACSIAV